MVFDKGVSFGGFIFVEKLLCCVSEVQVLIIMQSVDGVFVGVFVNYDIDEVVLFVVLFNFFVVQFYGSEYDIYILVFVVKFLEGCEIWKVEGVKVIFFGVLLDVVNRYLKNSFVSCVFLDC